MTQEKKPDTDYRDTVPGQVFGYFRYYVAFFIIVATIVAGHEL